MMSKPKMFLASSNEASFAARVFSELVKDHVTPIPWFRGARPSETIIEFLERMAAEVDLAVVMVTPEDQITSRNKSYDVARDNVIFELGFFIGKIGRKNTFIVLQEDADLKLPSDLDGVIRLTYPKPTAMNYREALESPALRVQEAVITRRAVAESRAVYLPELTSSFPGGAQVADSVRAELVRNGSGRYECFTLSKQGRIAQCYETKPRGNWSVWANYNDVEDAKDLSAILLDQRLLVAILSISGDLALYRQINRIGTWGRPRLGAAGLRVGARLISTSPAQVVSVDGQNRVVIATVIPDGDGKLVFNEVIGPVENNATLEWIDAIPGMDDTVHVVAVDQRGGVWHARQLPVVVSQWSQWQSVATAAPPLGVQIMISSKGRLFVALADQSGRLLLRCLRHPDGTNWVEPRGFDGVHRVRNSAVAGMAFRPFDTGIRLYHISHEGDLHVFSIDEATLTGASEAVEVTDVHAIVSTRTGLDNDPILVGFQDMIEARRA